MGTGRKRTKVTKQKLLYCSRPKAGWQDRNSSVPASRVWRRRKAPLFWPNSQVVRAVCGMQELHRRNGYFQLGGIIMLVTTLCVVGSEGQSCICIPHKHFSSETTRSLQQAIVRFPAEAALLTPVVSVVRLVVHDEFVVHKVEAVWSGLIRVFNHQSYCRKQRKATGQSVTRHFNKWTRTCNALSSIWALARDRGLKFDTSLTGRVRCQTKTGQYVTCKTIGYSFVPNFLSEPLRGTSLVSFQCRWY